MSKEKSSSRHGAKRHMCQSCRFPPRTCICKALPPAPLYSLFQKCRILILQHPHELRRKNRSMPLVDLCVFGSADSDVHSPMLPQSETDFVIKTIVGRSLGPDRHTDVVNRLNDPEEVIVIVFPHKDAMDFEEGIKLAEERCGFGADEADANLGTTNHKKMTLLFIDATWKHAREMEAKISKSLNSKHWIRVQLVPTASENCDAHNKSVPVANDDVKQSTKRVTHESNNGGSPQRPFIQRRFQIRAPPSPNHLSTAECLAWVASRVERNAIIFESITKVLDYMVYLWRKNVDENETSKKRENMSQKPLEIKKHCVRESRMKSFSF